MLVLAVMVISAYVFLRCLELIITLDRVDELGTTLRVAASLVAVLAVYAFIRVIVEGSELADRLEMLGGTGM